MTKAVTRTDEAAETILQSELLRNERVVEHPTLGPIRLKRPNPDQERSIANERRLQFHRDMQDPTVLSREELERIAVQRGMWTKDTSERIEELTRKTGEAMGVLDAVGFKSVEAVLEEYTKVATALRTHYTEENEASAALDRYLNLDLEPALADRTLILDAATTSEVMDLLETADLVRGQVKLLIEMQKIRKELNDLHTKQTKLFIDSMESRADRAEELARVYFCTSTVATNGPLWPTFDAMWKTEPEQVTWLIEELYFFMNGITEEFRGILGRFGFLQRLSDTSDSSEDSPAQPSSNSDGASAEPEPTDSSEASE